METVPDGQAALAAARERRPDLILSDVMMPHLDGFGLVRELRADADLKTIPIILLSARAGEESRVEGLQQGADDYLIKPFSARELMARVAAHLDMARLRKEAAEQIRESEERFRAVVENMSDGLMLFDAQGFIYQNPASLRIHGFKGPPETRIEHKDLPTTWKGWDETGRPLAFEEWPVARVLRLESFQDQVLRAVGIETGQEFWASYNGLPILAANGKLKLGFITIRDITERKRAEEALRESRAKLKAAFASMTEAIFIADAEGRLIDFNEGFVRYHRFKDREECSRTIADCPRYLDAYFQDGTPAPPEMWAMARALRGETASDVEYMLRRKETGETWWGSYNFAPIKDEDGRIVGAVVAGREITDRKRAEEALRESEARFRLALKNSPVLVAMQDVNLVYRWAYNTRTRPPEEVVGKTDADLFAPEDLPPILEAKRRVLQTGEVVRHAHWLTSNGQRVFLDCYYEPVRDSAGNIIGVGIAAVNLTEQKRAEEAMKQYSQELARSNQDLEQFAYVASHDLQEPLRQVRAFVGMLKERHADKFDGKAAEYIGYVYDGAARMSELVRGLLDYSRVGSREARREPTTCQQALDTALSNLQASIAESQPPSRTMSCRPSWPSRRNWRSSSRT